MAPSKTMDAKTSVDTRSKARLFLELNPWALAMGSYRKSRPLTAFVFDFCSYIFASTLMHSAACVLNDILDRKLDAQGILTQMTSIRLIRTHKK
ncbi:hypothetical protein C0993_011976 [Termitomyces sp. T159_Od127]|nr:hypothetical protein C0993_011976 [Termitomyces sp. T159_Od127]